MHFARGIDITVKRTAITKDRLTNFSRDYQNSFYLEIIDLYKEDGAAEGTQILLHIPTI
jgi:hypothetical protein